MYYAKRRRTLRNMHPFSPRKLWDCVVVNLHVLSSFRSWLWSILQLVGGGTMQVCQDRSSAENSTRLGTGELHLPYFYPLQGRCIPAMAVKR